MPRKPSVPRFWIALGLVVVAAAAIAGGATLATTLAGGGPGERVNIPPTPWAPPGRTPPALPTSPPTPTRIAAVTPYVPTEEERRQGTEYVRERFEEMKRSGSFVTRGTTTAGSVVWIAGARIQLPPDAYVESYVDQYLPLPGYRYPPTPWLVIRRGGSSISISGKSGETWQETTAPGEEGAFDFLEPVKKPFAPEVAP